MERVQSAIQLPDFGIERKAKTAVQLQLPHDLSSRVNERANFSTSSYKYRFKPTLFKL